MSRFDQQMRDVERSIAQLTGNKTQATQFRRKLATKIQQAAAKQLPKIAQSLVKSGRAGWANDPDTPGVAVLVERGTGCVLLDPKGKVIQRSSPVSHPPTSGINEAAFIQHLKDPGNELFVPYMYLDDGNNVTVGIGTLLKDADAAKLLKFVERGTNKPAHPKHIENAFNKVQNSGLAGSVHTVFKPLTSIEISEAVAVIQVSNVIPVFLEELRKQRFFRDLDTFPVEAKMGLLDMVYTLGLPKFLAIFKVFSPVVQRRDWKMAAVESSRSSVKDSRNRIVQQWFEEAARQEPFGVNMFCTKRIKLFFK